MKEKSMFKRLYHDLLLSFILFSVITILTSLYFLMVQGSDSETHSHLLARFGMCLLGVAFMELFRVIRFKNPLIEDIVHYTGSLLIIWGLLYLVSFMVEVASATPYRDIAVSYTAVYVPIAIVIHLKKWWCKRRENNTCK